uniref:Uncharacterized protein n=1 Tax=Arion vulgaris TaxID=1028688 RepID=A0A0B7A1Q8_9EUPU
MMVKEAVSAVVTKSVWNISRTSPDYVLLPQTLKHVAVTLVGATLNVQGTSSVVKDVETSARNRIKIHA